ncbi:MAG: sigma-70 family RNA polymerase sigma factor, partial [Verrucomicrobiota bacterium]|nr:sigma-70 family RNA polymerase sigma factor [Verrucomicrobiota bacterium]
MDEDDELMRRLQGGEDTALNQLMTRWQTRVIGFIYRYVGNSTDAADLAQETFVRLFEKRASYKTNGKFSSWLFTIATNLCRNFFRWQKRHPTVALESHDSSEKAIIDSFSAPEDSPVAAAERNDLANEVREQIQALPHDLKTAV